MLWNKIYREYIVLTQKELKRQLHYEPLSGVFTRKISNHRSVKVGDIAGTKHPYGYIMIKVTKKITAAHRLAFLYMDGIMPNEVDHINHVRDDNRWINLRSVTRSENCKNNSKRKDNSSGVCGVHWKTRDKRWIAQIRVDGKNIWLGQYTVFSDAVNARKNAEVLYGFHENHGKDL